MCRVLCDSGGGDGSGGDGCGDGLQALAQVHGGDGGSGPVGDEPQAGTVGAQLAQMSVDGGPVGQVGDGGDVARAGVVAPEGRIGVEQDQVAGPGVGCQVGGLLQRRGVAIYGGVIEEAEPDGVGWWAGWFAG